MSLLEKIKKVVRYLVLNNQIEEALELLEEYSVSIEDELLKNEVASLRRRFSAEIVNLELKRGEKIRIRNSILELAYLINKVPKKNLSQLKKIIESIKLNIYEKKESETGFWDWIKLNLDKVDIGVPILSIILSFILFLVFYGLKKYDYYIVLLFGFNFLVAIIAINKPFIKYVKNIGNDKNQNPLEGDKIKPLLGLETTYGLNKAYKRALIELRRFNKNWSFVWWGWASLHGYWIVKALLFIMLCIETDNYIILVGIECFFYEISSLFIFLSFTIIYFQKENKSIPIWKFIFVLLFIVTLIAKMSFTFVGLESDNSLQIILNIISGLLGGLAIILLVGRLDSHYLAVPFWVIVFLYFYGLIQYSINDFEETMVKMIMLNVALVGKSLLIILFAWLASTNRFLYYFIVSNKKINEIKINMKDIEEYL